MMPLTHNEKMAVTATMLEYISDMPTESESALSAVIDALDALLGLSSFVSENNKLQASVRSIHEYMSPEFGFTKPENRSEFVALCQQLISERRAFYARCLSALTTHGSVREALPTAVPVREPVVSVMAYPVIEEAERLRFFPRVSTAHQQVAALDNQPIRMARYYGLRNCASVYGITLSKFENGRVGFSIALRLASDNNYDIFERMVSFFSRHNPELPCFSQSITGNHIPSLSAKASAKGFLEVLGFIFTAIEQFDGENHISEAKKMEIRASLEQFLEPVAEENVEMSGCVVC